MNTSILVITPVAHIKGVLETLNAAGNVTVMEDPSPAEVLEVITQYDAIFTNPNKSKVFIGPEIMDAGVNLRVIGTASTGTNHIDKDYAKKKGIPVISITEEWEVINKISSTAEHAFALMMASLRHLPRSFDAVKQGEWDYTHYIGRQVDHLTVGVIGFGRLGSKFARYCRAFGARVLVTDPFKSVDEDGIEQVDLEVLLPQADVLSLHVHATAENYEMVDNHWFSLMKPSVLVVNTARGDIIKEDQFVAFLERNEDAQVAIDVVADEIKNRLQSPLILSRCLIPGGVFCGCWVVTALGNCA